MAPTPHFTQTGATPSVTGAGFGMFGCRCGQSLLIAGYEPRNFLGIAIRSAACGRNAETPGLPAGAAPPPAVTGDTVLISREEMERLASLHQPRSTEADSHAINEALLDDVSP